LRRRVEFGVRVGRGVERDDERVGFGVLELARTLVRLPTSSQSASSGRTQSLVLLAIHSIRLRLATWPVHSCAGWMSTVMPASCAASRIAWACSGGLETVWPGYRFQRPSTATRWSAMVSRDRTARYRMAGSSSYQASIRGDDHVGCFAAFAGAGVFRHVALAVLDPMKRARTLTGGMCGSS
jgi:hypothetical protein